MTTAQLTVTRLFLSKPSHVIFSCRSTLGWQAGKMESEIARPDFSLHILVARYQTRRRTSFKRHNFPANDCAEKNAHVTFTLIEIFF